MLAGTLLALAAGLMWGLVFIAPVWLPEYPALLLSAGRYLAFGLLALPLAWLDRERLGRLTRADWREALKLSLVGNLMYYAFLASAIQRAGAPLPTMIIGTLPVVIAVCSNWRDAQRDGRLPWVRLLPSLALIGCGIALVNHAELQHMRAEGSVPLGTYALGALLAVGAVACWTWYPLRNADWLRAHGGRNAGMAGTWATAQGIATLPLALLACAGFLLFGSTAGFTLASPGSGLPLGPRPFDFAAAMLTLGLLASWLGTLCWNGASQRLPTTLVGQLIVFETLSALAYAFALRGRLPSPETWVGIGLLVAGVMWALRVRPQPLPAHAT